MAKPMARSYRDLEVWQRAMELVLELYKATETFPAEERFNLTEQIRRAAVSIPTNIAEGHGRGHRIFARHLNIAIGSAAEVDTLLELAHRLGYLPQARYQGLTDAVTRIRMMLFRLYKAIHETPTP